MSRRHASHGDKQPGESRSRISKSLASVVA